MTFKDKILYYDNHHLTKEGTVAVSEILKSIFYNSRSKYD